MVRNSFIFCCLIFASVFQTIGQDRYVVFFTDKNNSPYSVDSPEAFLSQRALDRRIKNQIDITVEDLPVNETYIQQLRDLGINVALASKWLNAVLVEATAPQISDAQALAIVSDTYLVGEGTTYTSRIERHNKFQHELNGLETMDSHGTQSTDVQNMMLGVDVMHNLGFQGENVFIAILDAGFENTNLLGYFSHLYDEGRIKYTFNMVNNTSDPYTGGTHGTWVLGCMAAKLPGVLQGTAPNADYALIVSEEESTEYVIEEYNWVIAAERADSMGVDIINSSLGYSDFDNPPYSYTPEDLDGNTFIVSQGASIASSKGIVVVNSAANLGNDTAWNFKIAAPADVDELIAVGALNSDSTKASFSSIGPTADGRLKPDVSTLGVQVTVGYNETTMQPIRLSGTSFSSPLVAGLAAGVIQAFPNMTKIDVINTIRESGHQSNDFNNQIGNGIPSFTRIWSTVVGIETQPENVSFIIYPNPAIDKISINFRNQQPEQVNTLEVFSGNGQLIKTLNVRKSLQNDIVTIDVNELPAGLYIVDIKGPAYAKKLKFLKH